MTRFPPIPNLSTMHNVEIERRLAFADRLRRMPGHGSRRAGILPEHLLDEERQLEAEQVRRTLGRDGEGI